MANLAYGLKPLEDWNRPEDATNGKVTEYTGNKGFAYNIWPCTYTLDLKGSEKVKFIRFLLWDGLGRGNIRDNRRYQYILKSSTDGHNWFELFTTSNEGTNGWQVFKINKYIDARFVRLDAISNSSNGEFHIVEFEVHNEKPPIIRTEIRTSISIKTNTIQKASEDKEILELKHTKTNIWTWIKRLAILIGIIASGIIINKELIISDNTQIKCEYSYIENLTKENLKDDNSKIESVFYFQGEEIKNLWRGQIRFINSSNKTILGEGINKNIMNDSICFEVSNGFHMIDKDLISSDFTHYLNINDNYISIHFSQWRKGEILEYYLYFTTDSMRFDPESFLSEFKKRQLEEGNIIFLINDKSKQKKTIDKILPTNLVYISNVLILLILLLIFVGQIIGVLYIIRDYNKWLKWLKNNRLEYVKFIKTKNLGYTESKISQIIKNPNTLSSKDWEGFIGEKFPKLNLNVRISNIIEFLVAMAIMIIVIFLTLLQATEVILTTISL